MNVLTAKSMRLLEEAAVEDGLDYLRLMENAGSAAARYIRSIPELKGTRAVILCGRGNNGGDGYVIARKLLEADFSVTVVKICGAPRTAQAAEMSSRLTGTAVTHLDLETEPYMVTSTVKEADLIVDAVYGIGFHGELPAYLRGFFRTVNGTDALRVAVDVPSGLDSDTGVFDAEAFRADETVTFTAMKPGLLAERASSIYGKVTVAAIGIDPRLISQFTADQSIIDWEMVAHCFSPRDPDSHKGTYGQLLVLCGSYGMAGAAMMAVRAAQRCGVGLATAAVPRSVYPLMASSLPEAVFLPLEETVGGQVALAALPTIRQRMRTASAMVLGCGLGTGEEIRQVVRDVLENSSCPLVLDADGINAVAAHIDIRKTTAAPLVLTPHPGEMARLTGLSIAEVQADRVELARRFAEEQEVVLVLKGNKTVIAAPGRTTLINTTGNPGMATGGSGDVLAGMIGSFLAQGMEPYQAAMCGVHLHGLAGDRAAARLSQHAMLPTDLLDELGGLFSQLENA